MFFKSIRKWPLIENHVFTFSLALEQRLSTLTGTGLSNKIWESKTPAVSSQFNRHQPTLHHSFSSAEYARARELAYQAMSRPVLAPDLQIPTSNFNLQL